MESSLTTLFNRSLYLNTTSKFLEVALLDKETVLWSKRSNGEFSHVESITVFVEQCMEDNNMELSSVSSIIVNTGPGSYTGIRVGLSVAKGISFSLNIPIVPVTRFDLLMANGTISAEKFIALVHARESEYYAQSYNSEGKMIDNPFLIDFSHTEMLKYDKNVKYLISNDTLNLDNSLTLISCLEDIRLFYKHFLKSPSIKKVVYPKALTEVKPTYIKLANYNKKKKQFF